MSTQFSTKQAFLFTVINYFGVLIGVFSTLFIYPKDKDLLGIFAFIDGFSQILYPIMVLGASTALLNFQPTLNAFLQRKLFSYSMVSIVWMIFLSALGVLAVYFFDWYSNKEYYVYGFLIAICLAYVDLFKRQAMNLQKIAIPTFFEKILPKIILPLAFVLILFYGFSETQGISVYTFSFVIMLLAVGGYLFRFFKPVYTLRYDDLFRELSKKSYYQYSLYAFCASLGSFFAFRLDSIMIPHFLTNEANGDFRIGVNLANALMIPATGVFALYSPIISKAIKNSEMTLLKIKYTEVAKNLFFIGILMYGCVLLGIQGFFELLPTADKLLSTLPVLYLLGANVVLNMATGFNTEIIAYSKFYRFNLIAILLLAVLNVSLNYYILTQTHWGIVGVACATLLSTGIFNISKLIFIYKKFRMLPFDAVYAKVFLVAICLLVLLHFLPINNLSPFAFVVKCAFFVLGLTGICYQFCWVSQLNVFVQRFLSKIRKN